MSTLAREETGNLTNLIFIKEKWILSLKCSNKEDSRLTWLHWRILFDREIIPILFKFCEKTEEERTPPSINLIPKPDKDITEKEDYRQISLMSVGKNSSTKC